MSDIVLTRNSLTRMAKSVGDGMTHTQKLTAFARVLGYPDQTALMGHLKVRETSGTEKDATGKRVSVNDLVNEIMSSWLGSAAGTDHDPFDRGEWRDDVNRGDTSQGYDEWRGSQVDHAIDNWGDLDRAVSLYVSGDFAAAKIHARRILERFSFLGFGEVLGDDVMGFIEDLAEAPDGEAAHESDRLADVSRMRARVEKVHLNFCNKGARDGR